MSTADQALTTPEAPLPTDPEGIVRDFLDSLGARQLDRARAHLAPGFRMVFPGDARMTTLEELAERMSKRFRWARKTIERFDVAPGEDEVVVYCFGTLHGQWLDGSDYEGIRFVDRFVLKDGKIVDQKVWNDMAEVRSGL
jgi:hypothetical protein